MEQPSTSRRAGRPRKGEQAIEDATGLRRVRLALGLTQTEMAAELMCSISSIARYEREGTLPEVGALRAQFEKMAKRAGVQLEGEAAST